MKLFELAPWKRKKEPEPVAAEPGEPEDAHEKACEEARMRVIDESMQRALGRLPSRTPASIHDYCPHDWVNW